MPMAGFFALTLGAALVARVDDGPPATTVLPRSSPEAQGVSSASLSSFIGRAEQDRDRLGLHGLVVLRHGHVILDAAWSPYNAAIPHSLYSLSKSFTSTAVGLAIAEGKLSLDDPVLKFFPDDAPSEPSKNLRSMRVRDLLRMATGHQGEPRVSMTDSQPWTKTFLVQPVPFKPGSHFLYNTPATYMASAIVQKVTGQTVLDYLKPRLFDPLGIKDPTWGASPQGITLGGYGLSLRTEEIARFGQLLLQKGRWQGKQVVPEEWIAEATTRQISNGSDPASDWDQGYGYQFWRCTHGAFRGDGAFGQFCVVLPEQDAVVAITSGSGDLQGILNLVWSELLPAFQPSAEPANSAAEGALKLRLANLRLRAVEGESSNETARRVTGRRYAFPSNPLKFEALSVEAGDTPTLILRADGQDRRIPLKSGDWVKGEVMALGPIEPGPTASTGAWTDAETLTTRVAFVSTPFVATFRLKFTGDEVQLAAETNVGFGPTRLPPLTGRADPK